MTENNSFIKSLIAVQKELPTLKKDKENPFFKSKYAPLETVIKETLPILNKHGFALMQQVIFIETKNGEGVRQEPALMTRLLHAEGGAMSSTMLLLLKSPDPQQQGSAISYARRYALMSMLGLVAEAEDDDAEATREKGQATPKPKPESKPKSESDVISEPQRKRLYAIASTREEETGIPREDLVKEAMGSVIGYKEAPESTKDIQRKDYEKICEKVETLEAKDFGVTEEELKQEELPEE